MKHKKWEYEVLVAEDATIDFKVLNELGALGWELVGFSATRNCSFIFKRPNLDGPPEYIKPPELISPPPTVTIGS